MKEATKQRNILMAQQMRVQAAERRFHKERKSGFLEIERKPNDLLNFVQLQNRGWTETLVKRFLGAADCQASCTYSGNHSNLYLFQRVQEVEACAGWTEALARNQKRKAALANSRAQKETQRAAN